MRTLARQVLSEPTRAQIRRMHLTSTNATFAEWEAVFDEAEEDAGRYVEIISDEVFAAGWAALNEKIRRS